MPTEEQTTYNNNYSVRAGGYLKVVQKLLISNRIVSHLSFRLYKYGTPSGDVTFEIRRISPDEVIASKVWGNITGMSTAPSWLEVELDSPVLINEIVRIGVSFPFGDVSNRLKIEYNDSDIKADEYLGVWNGSTWSDAPTADLAYIYTYEEEAVFKGSRGYIIGG